MYAYSLGKPICRWLVLLLAVIINAAGCSDVTVPHQSTTSHPLTSELPESGHPVASPSDQSVGGRPIASSASQSQAGTAEGTAASPPGAKHVTVPESAAVRPIAPSVVAPKESVAIPAVQPDEIYEPTVVLSRAHEQTCLVQVGDVLPNLALQRLTGEPVSLDELRGEKLTVVVFWTNRLAFSREQFELLGEEVALPFRHLRVKVVAVNVGDPIEQIELNDVTKAEVTCVLDPNGSETAKVAPSKLPRTYLVDGEGRILWFDIEYSRTTRRQLKNAIFFFSREQADVAS